MTENERKQERRKMRKNSQIKEWFLDIAIAVIAGVVVGSAYHIFQNSNGLPTAGGSRIWIEEEKRCTI